MVTEKAYFEVKEHTHETQTCNRRFAKQLDQVEKNIVLQTR